MSIHIRVVTPVVPTGLTKASDFEGILSSSDRVTFTEIENGPASVKTAFDAMAAAPDVVAKIIEAEEIGADAVVIDCMEEPGLQPGRECVSIPVLGPCQTVMGIACNLGHRFSILAVAPNMRVLFENKARISAAWEKYASTRSVDIAVANLAAEPQLLKENLLEQAMLAIEIDAADTLILGCTGMIDVAQWLQQRLHDAGQPVPVLDPMPLTIRIAKVLAQSGVSHSKAAYPSLARRQLRGYENSTLKKFST
ncbi:MAG: hydrogenase expression protein HupH [Marinicaulis sp.]|nr:hydrogenase expression protein HupH [Marinicaulis sp.]